jgi:hypothetical protein
MASSTPAPTTAKLHTQSGEPCRRWTPIALANDGRPAPRRGGRGTRVLTRSRKW